MLLVYDMLQGQRTKSNVAHLLQLEIESESVYKMSHTVPLFLTSCGIRSVFNARCVSCHRVLLFRSN